MLDHLLECIGALAVAGVWTAVRLRLARSRRGAVRRGSAATMPARLGLDRDGAWQRGAVAIVHGIAAWYPHRSGEPVALDGAHPLRTESPGTTANRSNDSIVRLVLADGRVARVRLFPGDAATVTEVLAHRVGHQPPPLPRSAAPRFRGWAIASLALGAAVVLLYLAMALSAAATTATVTRSVNWGDCEVSYADSKGHALRGEIDCEGQQPGQRLTVWRFSDEPDDADEPVWFSLGMLTTALVTALPGLLHLLWFRRRRRAWLGELSVRTRGALTG